MSYKQDQLRQQTSGFCTENHSPSKTISKTKSRRLTRKSYTIQTIQKYDTLKILALQKIKFVVQSQVRKLLNNCWIMLIQKKIDFIDKKHGFATIITFIKTKQIALKLYAVKAIVENSKYLSTINKYFLAIIRIHNHISKKNRKQTFRIIKNVYYKNKGLLQKSEQYPIMDNEKQLKLVRSINRQFPALKKEQIKYYNRETKIMQISISNQTCLQGGEKLDEQMNVHQNEILKSNSINIDLKNKQVSDLVGQWQDIIQIMIQKIKNKEIIWRNDINRKKRWISSHKDHEQLVRMVNNDINMIKIISDQENNKRCFKGSIEQRPSFIRRSESLNRQNDKFNKSQIAQLSRQNFLLNKQIQSLIKRLDVVESESLSHWQISDLEDILYSIHQTLTSEKKYQPICWFKLRNSFQSFEHDKLKNIINCFSSLIKMIEKQLDQNNGLLNQFSQINNYIEIHQEYKEIIDFLQTKLLDSEKINKLNANIKTIIRKIYNQKTGSTSRFNSFFLESAKQKLTIIKTIKQLKQQNIRLQNKISKIQYQKQTLNFFQAPHKVLSETNTTQRVSDHNSQQTLTPLSLDQKVKLQDIQIINLNVEISRLTKTLAITQSQKQVYLKNLKESEYYVTLQKNRYKCLEAQMKQIECEQERLRHDYQEMINKKDQAETMLKKLESQTTELLSRKEVFISCINVNINDLEGRIQKLQQLSQQLILKGSQKQIASESKRNIIDNKLVQQQVQNLKEQLTTIIQQKTILYFKQQKLEIKQKQLYFQLEKLRNTIKQQKVYIQNLKKDKKCEQISTSQRQYLFEQENVRLIEELQKTLSQREYVFKSYEQTLLKHLNQKTVYENRLNQKQAEITDLKTKMQAESFSVKYQQAPSKQIQVQKQISIIICNRLASQQEYYKKLLSISNESYAQIIKNQGNEIQMLTLQVASGFGQIEKIKQLETQVSKLRREVLNGQKKQDCEMSKKTYLKEQCLKNKLDQKEEQFSNQTKVLKHKIQLYEQNQKKMTIQLKKQDAYLNGIINDNIDCYVNNQKAFIKQIGCLKSHIQQMEQLLKKREQQNKNQKLKYYEKQDQLLKLQSKLHQIKVIQSNQKSLTKKTHKQKAIPTDNRFKYFNSTVPNNQQYLFSEQEISEQFFEQQMKREKNKQYSKLTQIKEKLDNLHDKQVSEDQQSEDKQQNQININSVEQLNQVKIILRNYCKTNDPTFINEIKRVLYKTRNRKYMVS